MRKMLLLVFLSAFLSNCEREDAEIKESKVSQEEKLSSHPLSKKKTFEPDALPSIPLPHIKL